MLLYYSLVVNQLYDSFRLWSCYVICRICVYIYCVCSITVVVSKLSKLQGLTNVTLLSAISCPPEADSVPDLSVCLCVTNF